MIIGTALLPEICPGCLANSPEAQEYLCKACANRLRELPGPRCHSCGGTIDGLLDICGECLDSNDRPWDHAVTVFAFGGLVRELIHRLKYQKGTCLVPPMANRMANAWRTYGCGKPDVVSFVPMHWIRKLVRGYNQAELLAAEIARDLGVPFRHVLKRVRWSRKQVSLNRDERQKNLKHVFRPVNHTAVRGRKILLVDDVFTTGATLEAATAAVLTCEPEQVAVLTLARG